MAKSLYLINPRAEAPSYFGAEVFEDWGYPAAQGIADLATTTVAALAPPDWQITICEEYVDPIDWDSPADFIGLTGKINQAHRIRVVAQEFRRRGKTVIIGGPHASLMPEAVRDHCDIVLVGELEALAAEFFADLEASTWKKEYVADRPDLTSSPLPRWDLYPNDRTLIGCVQTSRGCPFECEFCDVIQYLGRKQRHKSLEQITAELDVLYRLGYQAVFLADDNFTVYRKRAKAILTGLRDWNHNRPDGPMALSTQVSIDAARDPEILQLCAEAGVTWVYIGIETPNEESLRETKKRQNVGVNLIEQVQAFLDHGIAVGAGLIAGFDHDGPDIFERLYQFTMASPIPFFSLGALNAPAATPLYARMEASGRLIDNGSEISSGPWQSNMIPAQMTREQLFTGLHWVCNRMYQPAAFGQRVLQMIAGLGPQRGPFKSGSPKRKPRPIETQALGVMRKLIPLGPEEREMWRAISAALAAKPEAGQTAMMMLFRYAQVRCLYQSGSFWDPAVPQRMPAFDPVPLVPNVRASVSLPVV